jgi:tripartite-type tricarboxylate transporter receptor subunit TctC
MKIGARVVMTFLVLLLGIPTGYSQQNYPDRLIKIIVPNPPGGLTDIAGRVLAQKLAEAWGRPVVVENRPGGDELIAGEAVAQAMPDGYTLYMGSTTGITIAPQLHKEKKFDPLKDLTPILIIGQATPVMLVRSSLPANSFQEFIALVKSSPGKLNYGSFGSASYAHLAMEDLKQRTGIDIMHIPYRGAAPAYTALLQGEIAVLIGNLAGAQVHVSSGKARIIAAAGAKRSAFLPDLPTIAETVPGFATGAWWGLFGPANLPQPIIDKLQSEWVRALNTPEMKQVYQTNTLEPVELPHAQLAQFLKEDQAQWGKLLKQVGLAVE